MLKGSERDAGLLHSEALFLVIESLLNAGGVATLYSQPIHEAWSASSTLRLFTQLTLLWCSGYQFNQWTPPCHDGYKPDNVVLISDGKSFTC